MTKPAPGEKLTEREKLAREVVNDIRNIVSYGCHMSYESRERGMKVVLDAFDRLASPAPGVEGLPDTIGRAGCKKCQGSGFYISPEDMRSWTCEICAGANNKSAREAAGAPTREPEVPPEIDREVLAQTLATSRWKRQYPDRIPPMWFVLRCGPIKKDPAGRCWLAAVNDADAVITFLRSRHGKGA